MKTVAAQLPKKRPFNPLLSESTVQQARDFTGNLTATVDSLLADDVKKQNKAQLSKQQQGDAIAYAWNQFHVRHGSFADDHSTL